MSSSRRSPSALDTMLRGGLDSLDLTSREHEYVVSRYTGLGVVLDSHWSPTHGDNLISPQGSFLLGTVVRNIWRNDDVDIDCVAVRDIEQTSITKDALKADVGVAAREYGRSSASGRPSVTECSRCWTLSWPSVHLDVLPAIPNARLGGTNLLITDREVRSWLPSNPAGYAAWFRSRMQEEQLLKRAIEAKRLEVEDVPEWLVKTTLQQTVQALKRHRDIFFGGRLDDRPASVVITTLAGLAYPGGGDLYDVLREVTQNMGTHLGRVDGVWTLPNPSQPDENFTDSWEKHPEAALHLSEWLDAAVRDFGSFGSKPGLHNVLPLLRATFGQRFAESAAEPAGTSVDAANASRGLYVATGGALIAQREARLEQTERRVRTHGFAGGGSPR